MTNILLVVAEIAHKDNWRKELEKWGGISNSSIRVECYASLKKLSDTQWDYIIFDEGHHLASDLRVEILRSIKAENIIILSATFPDNLRWNIESIFGNFVVSSITLSEAIDSGILPRPKIFLIPMKLDNNNYNCTIIEEWGNKEDRKIYKCNYYERWEYLKNKKKYPNVRLEISCTQSQKYEYLTSQFEYWKRQFFRTRQEYIKNKWLQVGSKRKRFLGECKTKDVKALLNKVKDKRFICFCASIEQAKLLGSNNAIHSERKDSLSIIDDFNNKKINSLFAVGMLQEGQNLNDIQIGVIVQLDGAERAFIQKFGRVLRADSPIQFIFYYENTRDSEYLENILETMNEDNNTFKEHIVRINDVTNLKLWQRYI